MLGVSAVVAMAMTAERPRLEGACCHGPLARIKGDQTGARTGGTRRRNENSSAFTDTVAACLRKSTRRATLEGPSYNRKFRVVGRSIRDDVIGPPRK